MNEDIRTAIREMLKGHMFHYSCDEDNWYACPKAPEGCSDESKGSNCDCGLEKRIDTLAKTLSEAVPEKRKTLDGFRSINNDAFWNDGWNAFYNTLLSNLRKK